MAKQTSSTSSTSPIAPVAEAPIAPVAEAPIAQAANDNIKKYYVVTCGGDFRFSPYKPEAKAYKDNRGHYVYGRGAAYLDIIPTNRTRVAPMVDAMNPNPAYVVVTESGLAAIKAYSDARGYPMPQVSEYKA